MAKPKRNIGLEILQGLREIKRGEHGRVINVPTSRRFESARGCRKPGSQNCLVCRCARFRNGNRAVAHPQVLHARCFSLHRRIPRLWLMLRDRNG